MTLFIALAIFEACPPRLLDDASAVRLLVESAVQAGGFTCHELVVVPFSPQGLTACAVVSESHVALHSWPELGRLFVDIASCSSRESVTRALAAIGEGLPGARLAVLEERTLG